MSMEHKAFIFDTEQYHKTIEPMLEKCCATHNTHDTQEIQDYISKHLSKFTSPYSGDPLYENWLDELETRDMQEFFDILLTSCYDCNHDIGLGYAWEAVINMISCFGSSDSPESYVLGYPLTYHNVVIDPGAMGLGVIEASEIASRKDYVEQHKKAACNFDISLLSDDLLYKFDAEELADAYDDLCTLYSQALHENKGLMFTF